jgi:hypothetical protein
MKVIDWLYRLSLGFFIGVAAVTTLAAIGANDYLQLAGGFAASVIGFVWLKKVLESNNKKR